MYSVNLWTRTIKMYFISNLISYPNGHVKYIDNCMQDFGTRGKDLGLSLSIPMRFKYLGIDITQGENVDGSKERP